MSKPKKLKKKGLSKETKETFSTVFRSIISNQACVDGGKHSPWWIAVIFLCFSILLPLIPMMVNASKTYGASFLAGNTYGADRGLYLTSEKYVDDNYKFNLKDGILSFEQNDTPVTFSQDNPFVVKDDIYEGRYNFRFYITDLLGDELTNLVNKLDNDKYEVGTLTPYSEDPEAQQRYIEEGTKFYIPNFIILAPNTLAMALYKTNDWTRVSNTTGGMDFANTPNSELLTERFYNSDTSLSVAQRIEASYSNVKNLMNEAYMNQKTVTFRNTTLIYFGVYTALIFFLGLMLFILTRGKNNPFNYLSFFTTQKIAWWASFTPALLGMILAFVLGNALGGMAQMSFVVLVALRVMWLSMKQLRPAQ